MTGKRKTRDDDFVLTLSDEENNDDVFDDEGEDGGPDFKELRSAKTTNFTKSLSTSKKRRREENDTGATNKKLKKQQQQKKTKGNKGGAKEMELDSDNDENEGKEEEVQEEDGVLDPDFEFDIGGAAKLGAVEEFDGWGMEDRNTQVNGAKKGADLDEILARRRQKILEGQKKQKTDAASDVVSEWDNEEDEEEEALLPNFDDDELLAPDAFGMGAVDESEDEDKENTEKQSEDESMPDADGSDDKAASDSDSIASPVAHPDDLQSDDNEDSEEEDLEEIAKRNAFFAPEDKSATAKETSHTTFQSFNLSRPILRGLAAVGFSVPTPIQRKAIPVGLLGKDLVGGAVTGSGKTAAFIIPILERLLYRPRKVPTSRVAILMPTRELAVQCYNVATKLATYTDITFCQLVGGFSLREQENVLKQRPDVIIATPGRFIDHMRNSASFTVDTLEILVLDEADRMLEDGFADELNEILTTIPKSRQTMLFSATMTDTVDKLIRVGLNRPVRLMVDSKKQTVGTLVQEFVRLRPGREGKRMGYLALLCSTVYTNRVIVFFRQKKEAHRARIVFGLLGLQAAELHGSMSQEQVSWQLCWKQCTPVS